MKLLNKVTSDAYQRFFLTGNPGQVITMTLRFMPSQAMWMMDLVYGSFVMNGIHVVSSPNIIRNVRNIVPFGIGCSNIDNLDPCYIDDFSNQRCKLYLLNATDVEEIEALYYE